MLLLRAPRADKRPRRGLPPQTPACWAQLGSHRLAFAPERAGKRPRCRLRLLHPRLRLLRAPLPRAAQPCPGCSGAAAALEMNIYIPWKRAARHRRGAGRRLQPKLVILPECEWARPRALGSGVLSFCFITLSIEFGKESRSFPIAWCHMEKLHYFDFALCKHFNIGSLKSRRYPKGD